MMAHLSLSLLGPFRATLDSQPITGFESNKVRAMLAYLAVEADRPHSRDVLAGTLWPNLPQRSALSNLRYALSNLRQAIGDRQARPAFLLITRETIQFNPASDYELDVATFLELAKTEAVDALRQAVALYPGSFLEGFSVGDSAAFEEWTLLTREQLIQQMLRALKRLTDYCEGRGDYEQAQPHAQRQVELEPWQEEGHQQLMRVLALGGQRSAALTQYEICRRRLADELGVEPAAETTALYERIRDGKLTAPPFVSVPLAFLAEQADHAEVEHPVFVARESELAQLDKFLEKALAGQGQVVFITGEPGSGKTALLGEFVRRAMETHADLVAANGNCNAHTGIGDPYLPFLETLQMLAGDIEAKWAGGAITREHAQRLWALLPEVVHTLLDEGPELIDRLVPGLPLLARAYSAAHREVTRLEAWLKRTATGAGGANVQQVDLFEQYTRVLHTLARRHPLLLAVDDLQWADAGSISLLFHLGRRLAGHKILIVGAYRPGDVALGRAGERHPLEPIVNEFQREFGDMRVDLTQAEGRRLVEAYLDTEPNQLGAAFRETLYRHTGGHPLFTIELLRGLQERGDLTRDEAGRWIEGPALDWATLPPRVEAVIAERISRLPKDWQATLAVASVEGEEFTAEAVARVLACNEQEIIQRLSGPLSRQSRLIAAQGLQRLGPFGQRLSRYRFRHYLFQKYLYGHFDEVERVHQHEAMGNALETLYGEQASEIAVQLARHFEAARMAEKAAGCLLQAGNKAVRLSAYQEAIAHYRKGLELLETLPDTVERAQQELALQMGLGVPLAAVRGYADPEMGQAYARARELCRQLGATPELAPVLTGLGGFYSLRAQYQIARELFEEILAVSQRSADPTLLTIAHWQMGYLSVVIEECTVGRAHLERALSFYDPGQHRSLVSIYYQDPGVSCLTWLSWALWALGYADQALQRSREALALAEELSHPFTLAFALGLSAAFHFFRHEVSAAHDRAEAAIVVSSQRGFPLWGAIGKVFRGWALARQGKSAEGLVEMREGIAFLRVSGTRQPLPSCLIAFAEACAQSGQVEEGLNLLAEAQAEFADSGGGVGSAESYRLTGELLLQTGRGEIASEACFNQAIEVARRQQAKSWELRAMMSRCRLWQKQGRREEARARLAEIYNWFTEGLETPDLKEARVQLEALSSGH